MLIPEPKKFELNKTRIRDIDVVKLMIYSRMHQKL
jgi:hypothetical protein